MRVVYASSIDRYGPLSHVRDLAPAVTREGVDVAVLCLDETVAASFEALGVEAIVAPLVSKLDLRGASRVWRLLAGVDVVHTHDPRTGLLVRPQAWARGAHAVHTFHGLPDDLAMRVRPVDVPPPPTAANGTLGGLGAGHVPAEALLSRLGTVVAPSRAIGDYIVAHGVPRQRVRVIPYGIDVQRDEPCPPNDPPVIGTSAVLSHRKGIDVLLGACARLQLPYRLELYGDGPLRSELERQAAALGLPARFHGFREDMREHLLGMDLFVLPTRGDNLPVAILEAMAQALPVVSTRVGGVPEQVVDGVTGLVVDPDDEPGLASALTTLLADPALRRSYGRAAAQKARAEFDGTLVARRMVDLYEELRGARLRRAA
jgi:glycosyltransferase involved in cell wall biosynthesis